MIEHIVLINFVEGVQQNQLEEVIQKVHRIKEEIPGIIEAQAGTNINDNGYQFGIYMRFEDKAALDGYLPHPKHIEAVNLLKEIGLVDITSIDFEI
ncbi:stress protein [Alkalihalophilus pseudofirmus]|uniref:Dabb family protein n=1 Tax=Alkalihalobacterium alkalinitrilicum TaxID=427920 RepID=UPI00094D5A2B|nr:Dabb family protein [Alkalihalobacterium alkalinitrilicum]OLO37981.1 stress protein [Alkalihalophilus pseudofirmus]